MSNSAAQCGLKTSLVVPIILTMKLKAKFKWWWWRFKHAIGLLVYVENPLLKYPRNLPCWCGSSHKAKSCCLPKQAPVVDFEQGVVLRGYMVHVLSIQPGRPLMRL